MAHWLKRVLCGGRSTGSWMGDLGLLGVRAFVGFNMAVLHAWPVLSSSERMGGFTKMVEGMGFTWQPEIFAWAAKLSEGIGGGMLLLGIFTRPAALFLAFTHAMAVFNHHAPDPYKAKEMVVLYLIIDIMFLLKGSGIFSLDQLIRGGKPKLPAVDA